MSNSNINEEDLVNFYMWMQLNGYDHNIRTRVEEKVKMYLEQRKGLANETDTNTKDNDLLAVIIPSFLNELAEKHNVDVNELVLGMQFGNIQVWRYDAGVWKTLEIISKDKV